MSKKSKNRLGVNGLDLTDPCSSSFVWFFLANELKEVANDIIFGNSLKGKETEYSELSFYGHQPLYDGHHIIFKTDL